MRTLRERSPSVHPDIVLVEINDATIRDLKEIVGRWPWPRAVSAMLIDYLHRGAPKVIAVDIGFWEKEREASYQFNGEAYTSARSDGDLAECGQESWQRRVARGCSRPRTGRQRGSTRRLVGTAVSFGPGKSKNGRSSRCPTTCWRRRPQGLDTTSSPLTVTVPLGESLLSCARGRDSCPRSAWPRHSSPVAIVRRMSLSKVARYGSAIVDVPLVRVQVTDAVDPSKRHDQQTMLINYRAPTLS